MPNASNPSPIAIVAKTFGVSHDTMLNWIAPRIMHLFRIYLHYISFALHLHFIYISHSSRNIYIFALHFINISKCQINVK